jgi:ATP-dependent 26S proteasome regulatory subunit
LKQLSGQRKKEEKKMLLTEKEFGELKLAKKYEYLEEKMKRIGASPKSIAEVLKQKDREEIILGRVNDCLLMREERNYPMEVILYLIHRALTDDI